MRALMSKTERRVFSQYVYKSIGAHPNGRLPVLQLACYPLSHSSESVLTSAEVE
ncbi:MAG: hypothetical protein ACJA1F_001484 [Paracoccaceae bacterium]|jgi:hypothetical protein